MVFLSRIYDECTENQETLKDMRDFVGLVLTLGGITDPNEVIGEVKYESRGMKVELENGSDTTEEKSESCKRRIWFSSE